jgi:hypothetical protein
VATALRNAATGLVVGITARALGRRRAAVAVLLAILVFRVLVATVIVDLPT